MNTQNDIQASISFFQGYKNLLVNPTGCPIGYSNTWHASTITKLYVTIVQHVGNILKQ